MLTSVVVPPELVRAGESIAVCCSAGDIELLLLDWLGAVVYWLAQCVVDV
jgi:hypothetical protein